ncbi:MAG: hypothetical protein AAF720_09250 [Pseudomonadota bacterium]
MQSSVSTDAERFTDLLETDSFAFVCVLFDAAVVFLDTAFFVTFDFDAVVFLTAAFLVTLFFAVVFFVVVFLEAAFFTGAFLELAFFTTLFFAATLLAVPEPAADLFVFRAEATVFVVAFVDVVDLAVGVDVADLGRAFCVPAFFVVVFF